MSEKYRCAYKYEHRFGNPIHLWTLVGPLGGMHLTIRDGGADSKYERYSGGIEIHSRTPLRDAAPDHDECWLIHAPCWHDGSSLAVTERWIPRWLNNPHDHDLMFLALEAEAEEWFSREGEDDE
jgi:hypothetical protein